MNENNDNGNVSLAAELGALTRDVITISQVCLLILQHFDLIALPWYKLLTPLWCWIAIHCVVQFLIGFISRMIELQEK